MITDLYRDFDDLLTLTTLIKTGHYNKITIVTSNEVNGKCAAITSNYLEFLHQSYFDLHGRNIDLSVVEGLAGYDFAPFMNSGVSDIAGIHYPPEVYSANMRVPSLNTTIQATTLPEWYQQLGSNGEAIDVISIGKIADLDMVLRILEAVDDVNFRTIKVLGGKPNKVSTNTNCSDFHFDSMPDGTIMLDGRYGGNTQHQIFRTNFLFSHCQTKLLSISNKATKADKVFFDFITKLRKQSPAALAISELLVSHLAQLQYERASTFDVFTLFSEQHLEEQALTDIYFSSSNTNKKIYCLSEFPDRSYTLIKHLKVIYPSLEQMEKDFITHLINSLNSGDNTMTYKAQLSNLSHSNQLLLQYYGNWENSIEMNASLSINGTNEYDSIRKSMFFLLALLNNDNVEQIKETLTTEYNEDNFYMAAADDTEGLTTNLIALIKMRDDFRQKHGMQTSY